MGVQRNRFRLQPSPFDTQNVHALVKLINGRFLLVRNEALFITFFLRLKTADLNEDCSSDDCVIYRIGLFVKRPQQVKLESVNTGQC